MGWLSEKRAELKLSGSSLKSLVLGQDNLYSDSLALGSIIFSKSMLTCLLFKGEEK